MLPLIFPGFLSSSIIGRAPWPPSLDGPGPWISRVRPILARISQDLSYPPGASHRHASRPSLPFSTRIPTGVRTDSGEERPFHHAAPGAATRHKGLFSPSKKRSLVHLACEEVGAGGGSRVHPRETRRKGSKC